MQYIHTRIKYIKYYNELPDSEKKGTGPLKKWEVMAIADSSNLADN